jgi:hypothetical protein
MPVISGVDLRITENDVMAHRLLVTLSVLGASFAVFGPVLAQAPPEASKSPATSPAATPPAPAAQESDSSATPKQAPAPSSTPTASPNASPNPPPSEPAASPAPAAPATPSADTIKKARVAGYRPETRNGTTMFCQETANIGTRFSTKKCLDEQQLKGVLDIQNENHDRLIQPNMCAGSGCAGN